MMVFFDKAGIGTQGGSGADAVLQACCKVVCWTRSIDQQQHRMVLVDEFCNSRVISAVGRQRLLCSIEHATHRGELELCWRLDLPELPSKFKKYLDLGYKRLRDCPPMAQQQQQPAAQLTRYRLEAAKLGGTRGELVVFEAAKQHNPALRPTLISGPEMGAMPLLMPLKALCIERAFAAETATTDRSEELQKCKQAPLLSFAVVGYFCQCQNAMPCRQLPPYVWRIGTKACSNFRQATHSAAQGCACTEARGLLAHERLSIRAPNLGRPLQVSSNGAPSAEELPPWVRREKERELQVGLLFKAGVDGFNEAAEMQDKLDGYIGNNSDKK
ncbi:hypothetical protein QJQ45_004333 [Haematococcus lacustris]|nr:hypothetical protein QJQ45_004333 [Haematococcus lacustris]